MAYVLANTNGICDTYPEYISWYKLLKKPTDHILQFWTKIPKLLSDAMGFEKMVSTGSSIEIIVLQ